MGPASKTIAKMKPLMWWRLNEFSGPLAVDDSGNHHEATYEGGVAYYLDGPDAASFTAGEVNRAPHFVGGRLCSEIADLGADYSISLWLWNGMPNDARDVSGWLYSRDHNHGLSSYGEHLGVGGKSGNTGRLIFQSDKILAGKTEVPRWTWQHVVLVRAGSAVRVYLNGALEIEGEAKPSKIAECFFGGRSDNDSGWEGRLDEIAVFNRALNADEVARLGAGSQK